MLSLKKHFSFSQNLLDDAIAFPSGNFVEMNDWLYELNHVGLKIVQTQLVEIGGKEVSIATYDGDGASQELVIASENPVDLGNYESIMLLHQELFVALHHAFQQSDAVHYLPIEMVVAIRSSLEVGVDPANVSRLKDIAVDARIRVKRGVWIARNHVTAFEKAPVDWRALGM